MRAWSHVLLWASLAGLAAFWLWGEQTYRTRKHALFSAALHAVPIHIARTGEVYYPPGEDAAKLKQEFDAAARRETAAYVMWRDTSAALFALVLCAAGWAALSPAAPSAPGRGRTQRGLVRASLIGAVAAGAVGGVALSGGAPVVGGVYADEYGWVALLNTGLVGVIAGALAGAVVGGLFAWIKRAEPGAAADRGH